MIKSDLPDQSATAETIHGRYKDLSYVEWAFRSSKTVELELRPIHVRLETRTRGHVFVVMLAYRIIQELAIRWQHLDITVEDKRALHLPYYKIISYTYSLLSHFFTRNIRFKGIGSIHYLFRSA